MKPISEKNCSHKYIEPKSAILEAINFLKLENFSWQDISDKNRRDLFPHT